MRGLARSAWLQAAITSMRISNATASRILRQFGVTACTDVTGFGLAGHLLEMLRASSVAAVVWPDRLPALPDALELASHGVASTLAPENRKLMTTAGTDARAALVIDPQTSGGLLACVATCRGLCHGTATRALRRRSSASWNGAPALRFEQADEPCNGDPDH
jgi:selenide, water dikinase